MVGTVAPKAGWKVDKRNKDLAFIFILLFKLKGVTSFQVFLVAILKAFHLLTMGHDGSFYTFYY